LLRRSSAEALGHHALNLGLQASTLAMPMVVVFVLSTTANAYFYAAWMLVSFLAFMPYALTLSLYVVGAADPEVLADKVRFTLRLALVIALGANVVLMLGASPMLRAFGPLYARNAAWTLRILGLAIFPLIVKDHYVAICRIRARVAGAAVWTAAAGLLELLLAALGARLGGLVGLSGGYLLALCVEAACMAPVIHRVVVPESPPIVVGNK
jgi:O-antigen/teichoic acid export membrane protein